jgi:t-SNARE complex subunit (syntaxin)
VSADRKDWKTLRDSSIKRIEDYIANISNMADELDASNKKKKDWVDNLDRQLETVLA